MKAWLVPLLLLVPAATPDGGRRPAAEGLTIERTASLSVMDPITLDPRRARQVRRKEVLRIRGGDASLTDLTFGERLIIRSGARRVLKADPLGGVYSEYSFEEVHSLRKRALEEIRSAQARLAGSPEAKDLEVLLEGYDQFKGDPKVELRVDRDGNRSLLVNGDLVRLKVPAGAGMLPGAGYFEVLSHLGAFHPRVAAKLKELGGFPEKGTLRYVLFLDRVTEDYEVASVRKEEIPDAEFELPPGLRKVPLKGFEPEAEKKPAKPLQFRRDFREDEIDRQNNPLRQDDKKDKP